MISKFGKIDKKSKEVKAILSKDQKEGDVETQNDKTKKKIDQTTTYEDRK